MPKIEAIAKSETGLEYGYKVAYDDGFVVRVYFDEPVSDDWIVSQADERKDLRLRSFSQTENTKHGYYQERESTA